MSLLDLLKKGVQDVGHAANTAVRAATPLPAAQPVRPTIQQRPKPVVQTPGPAIQVQQPQMPRINPIQQIQQPKISLAQPVQQTLKPAAVAPQQTLLANNKPVLAGNTNTNTRFTPTLNNAEKFLASKPGTVGLGAARSLAGTGQAASGLVDLASRGTGTNRFSKLADVAAQRIDQSAANSNRNLYRGAQLGTDLATFGVGGGIAKTLPGATKVAQAANFAQRPALAVADRLAEGGLKNRIAGQTLRGATNPALLAGNVGTQGFYAGQQASRGENINPVEQLAQLAAGQVGIPLAGGLVKETAAPAVKAAVSGLRERNIIAPSRLNDMEVANLHRFNQSRGSYDMQDGDTYQAGLAAAQKAGIDANDPQAIDELVNAHLNHATQVQARQEALQGLGQRMQVGNEIGSVGRDVRGIAVDVPTNSVAPELPQAQRPATAPLAENNPVASLGKNTLESGFASGARRSAEVSPEAKAILERNQPTYERRSTKKLAESSSELTKDAPTLKSATDDVNHRLAVPDGEIDDRTVSDAIAVAKAHDANGDHDLASSIYEGLSGHLTKQGQTIQAASLLGNRTPEGLKLQATRSLKKGKVEVTPELQAKLDAAFKKVKGTKEGTDERFRAAQEYAKVVADSLPTSTGDKIASFWKAGLLTGIKTQTGNALSNGTFGALHGLSNPLAAGIDKALSLKTGVRTKTATAKGYGQGLKEGAAAAKDVIKTGIDERPGLANKYDQSGATFGNQHGEINFGKSPAGKAATVYVNGVFRLMGAADRPAYYAQLRNSLADLGKAEGLTKGLRGTDLDKYVDNFTKNPPKEQFQMATSEAEKAVLGNDTFLSNVANKARRAAGEIENPLGREAAKLGLNVVAPFTKVPSAFIGRVLDYTPVGAIKEIATQAATKKLDQRALSTALAEATTGTSLIYVGTTLANNGLLSGNYPNDPKEQARWKAEGVQPNSVKVGDSWKSLNYFGPLGALFSQGKRATDTVKDGGSKLDVAAGFTGGAAQDALGQSFLQGVSGALDAVQDPKRYAENYVRNTAGSVIPTLSKDVAEASDDKQRDTNTPGQSIQSRLPGVRNGLAVKQDVYGNNLDRKASPLDTLANPLRPSNAITNDVKSEVARLHDVDTNNKDLQVTPTPVDKTISVEGKRVKLNAKQRYDLQKTIGQATNKAWSELIKTPEYKEASDVDKAAMLTRARSTSTEIPERQFVIDNNLGSYAKSPSKSSLALAENTSTLAEVSAASKAGGSRATINKAVTPDSKTFLKKYNAMTADQRTKATNTQNDFEYNKLVADYDNKKASGKLSTVADIKAKEKIDKALVGKDYAKEIRDLHGLSKDELSDYLAKAENGKDKQKLAEQIIAYDDALTDKGIQAKNKFRLKDGSVAITPGGRKNKKKGGKGSKTVVNSSISYAGTAKSGIVNGLKQRKFAQPRGHVALKKITTGEKSSKGKHTKRVFA